MIKKTFSFIKLEFLVCQIAYKKLSYVVEQAFYIGFAIRPSFRLQEEVIRQGGYYCPLTRYVALCFLHKKSPHMRMCLFHKILENFDTF